MELPEVTERDITRDPEGVPSDTRMHNSKLGFPALLKGVLT